MFIARLFVILVVIALWRHYVLPIQQVGVLDPLAVETRWMRIWTILACLACG